MDEDQTPSAEQTASPTGQGTEQTSSVETPQGSEAQTNTGAETGDRMIPIPSGKWRETNQTIRQLKDEINSLKSQPAQSYQEPYEVTTEQDAVKIVAKAVAEELRPTLSSINRFEQEQAIEDIGSRPHANELAKDIAKHFASSALQGLPVRDRLDMAYKLSVGENFHNLKTQAEQTGRDSAYEKIAEKQSAEPSGSGASSQPGQGEITDENLATITSNPREYDKNRADIFRKYNLGEPPR